MIRHYRPQRNFSIGIMGRNIFELFVSVFPDVRQHHHSIHNLAEKMFTVFRADGNEIGSTIIIMPIGTGGFYSVFVLPSIIGHTCSFYVLVCRDVACYVYDRPNGMPFRRCTQRLYRSVIISGIYPTNYRTYVATKRHSAVSAPSGSRRGNRGIRRRGRAGWLRCRPACPA